MKINLITEQAFKSAREKFSAQDSTNRIYAGLEAKQKVRSSNEKPMPNMNKFMQSWKSKKESRAKDTRLTTMQGLNPGSDPMKDKDRSDTANRRGYPVREKSPVRKEVSRWIKLAQERNNKDLKNEGKSVGQDIQDREAHYLGNSTRRRQEAMGIPYEDGIRSKAKKARRKALNAKHNKNRARSLTKRTGKKGDGLRLSSKESAMATRTRKKTTKALGKAIKARGGHKAIARDDFNQSRAHNAEMRNYDREAASKKLKRRQIFQAIGQKAKEESDK